VGVRCKYQDQVGHFDTKLSPASTNSSGVSTPFSLKADTVRGPVILSTAPLRASWSLCDSTISWVLLILLLFLWYLYCHLYFSLLPYLFAPIFSVVFSNTNIPCHSSSPRQDLTNPRAEKHRKPLNKLQKRPDFQNTTVGLSYGK
jgi:hypothetical protein